MGAYSPAKDRWRRLGAPVGEELSGARPLVWTGSEAIFWRPYLDLVAVNPDTGGLRHIPFPFDRNTGWTACVSGARVVMLPPALGALPDRGVAVLDATAQQWTVSSEIPDIAAIRPEPQLFGECVDNGVVAATQRLDAVFVYDIGDDQWTTASAPPLPADCSYFNLHGHGHLIEFTSGDIEPACTAGLRYDATADAWMTTAPGQSLPAFWFDDHIAAAWSEVNQNGLVLYNAASKPIDP
jgi:hypothetical protein